MRFVHTADWHLGRQLHSLSLLEDQAYVLEQLVGVVADSGAQALVIAGDIYDRAVPPPEAVALLDEVLERIVCGLRVPVIAIAGNHDSPQRLGFGARLLAAGHCHLRGIPTAVPVPVELADAAGPVHFVPLPFAEPPVVRAITGRDDLHSHDAAMAGLLAGILRSLPAGERSVLVAHCFVAGGEASESERPLTIGGAGNVAPRRFAGFSYSALGHLHRPQRVKSERLHYSGSLLKYSLSEIDHVKSVNLVELDGTGLPHVERVTLTPRRDLRCIEGHLDELLAGPGPGESRDDYLLVRLLDTRAILDAVGKLRAVYPNVVHLERPGLAAAGRLGSEGRARLHMSEQALFSAFFEQVTGATPSETQLGAFANVVDAVRRAEREVAT